MRNRRFTAPRLAAALVLSLASLGTAATPALAGPLQLVSSPIAHPLAFSEPPASFGGEGSGPGQFGSEGPDSIAVEEATGDVFALDPKNGRVEKFQPNSKGEYEFLAEFGGGTPQGTLESESADVAVDNSTSSSKGDVYVSEDSRGEIEKFAPKPGKPNEYEWKYQLPVETVEGLAIDAKGDLYAASRFNTEVFRFGPEGTALASIPISEYFSYGLAMAPNGDLYRISYREGFSHASVVKMAIGPEGTVEAESVFNPGLESRAVAVGAGGHVYVVGSSAVEEYESNGHFVEAIGAGKIGYSPGIAYAPSGAPGIVGLLYVADSENHEVHVFTEPISEHPKPAINACSVERPTPVTAKVSCTVSPNAAKASVYVETQEIGSASHTSTTPQEISAAGEVTIEAAGLTAQKRYRYALYAQNENGTTAGEEGTFSELPAASELSACTETGVENESMILHGSFEGFGVAPSHWHFQYGPGFEHSTPEQSAESNKEAEVEAKIEGLAPRTSYPCQLVVSDEYGSAVGPTSQITTFGPPVTEGEGFEKVGSINATLRGTYDPAGLGPPVGPTYLPSTYYFEYGVRRLQVENNKTVELPGYEFKTPETSVGEEHGRVGASAPIEGLSPATEYHFRLVVTDAHGTAYSENGVFTTFTAFSSGLPDKRVYEMVTPPENENADVYAPEGPVAVGYADCGCLGVTATHRPFDVSLDGDAVAYVGDATTGGSGSIGPAEGNEYLAVRTGEGWIQHNITPPNGAIEGPEYHAFSPELTVGLVGAESFPLERLSPEAPAGYGNLYRRTLSVLHYEPLFTEVPRGHLEAYEGRGLIPAGGSSDFSHILYSADAGLLPQASESGGLYEWIEGQLQLVDESPGGAVVWPAEFGYGGDYSHVISNDGSRVFWTDSTTHDLYLRENGAPSVLVVEGGEFWTASSDGSKVFYTKEGDLYEYDVKSKQATDVAPKGEVYGVLGAGEDGEDVYFVAGGYLSPHPTAQELKEGVPQPVEQQPNLYLYHDGKTTFVGTLTFADNARRGITYRSHFGDWERDLGIRTSEVAPDGQAIVFESSSQLTSYNNEGQKEIYVYEAGSGKIFCASCMPTGEAPKGEPWLALGGEENPTIQARSISEDGTRVFFETTAALVPHDTNGVEDVYEWERDGAGTCERPSGCIFILSGGANADPSFLIGSSVSGDDVFFESREQLTSNDDNEAVNLFDAAVSTQAPAEPQCSGTSCQGVPFAPTEFEAPSTVTFAGVGNFPAGTETTEPSEVTKPAAKKCTKGKVRKHGKCVKNKQKPKKAKHARRASRARRSSKHAAHAGGKAGGR